MFKKGNYEFENMMAFNEQLFFYLVLPPIVFGAGYNMQRKDFYGNLRYIALLGLFGTLLFFLLFAILTMIYCEARKGKIVMYDGFEGHEKGAATTSFLELSTMEILLMGSLICSTDTVAATALLSPRRQANLFSVVFGEGIMNDAVAIILFNTMAKYHDSSLKPGYEGFAVSTVFAMAWDYCVLFLLSLLVGVLFGMLCSYILKKYRVLSSNAVNECTILFSFAYLSYVAAEMMACSGIISLLMCSVMHKEFSFENLSVQGKLCSVEIFEFL